MAFNPIELTTISRTQDYTTIKQNEDAKAYLDQNNLGRINDKNEEHHAHEVTKRDNSDWNNKKFDSREKGSNEYHGDGGEKRKKQEKFEDVVVKKKDNFDIRI